MISARYKNNMKSFAKIALYAQMLMQQKVISIQIISIKIFNTEYDCKKKFMSQKQNSLPED